MKKVEAIIRPTKIRDVLAALKEVGVTGINVIATKGQGRGERFPVRSSMGVVLYTAEYNALCTIITVVDDHLLNAVISSITTAAGTGNKGDGKIFISTIDDVVDINTKRSGIHAL